MRNYKVKKLILGQDCLKSISSTEKTQLHVVSLSKFVIVGVLSLGLYIAYCNYRHWLYLRGQSGLKLVPLLCATFSGFTMYWLMKNIIARSRVANQWVEGTALNVTLMWWLPTLATMSWRFWIPERFIEILPLTVAFMTPIIFIITNILFATVSLILIQQAANACEGDQLGLQNASITWANILWIVASWVPVAAACAYMVVFGPLMYFIMCLS